MTSALLHRSRDGVPLPAFAVRSVEAGFVVELPSGGSIALAGLIRDEVQQAVSGTPVASKVPVLGALFRHKSIERNETELVIIATPYLVRPVARNALARPGWFVAPTVIEGLGPDCASNREEIFGPVVTLQAFDSDADAVALANASEYGLSASVFTNDLKRAHRLAAQLQVGMVWINTWLMRDLRTPFGGSGASGMGREGGMEAMRFFTEPRNVGIAL